MIQKHLSNLLEYAKWHLGLKDVDTVYEANRLAEKLQLDSVDPVTPDTETIKNLDCPDTIVAPILQYALEKGLVEEGEEEFFTSEILDMLSPLPSKTLEDFDAKYAIDPDDAFNMLYDLGVKNDYVKLSAIRKNKEWLAETTKNKLQITINLSKPEKNNKTVAKMRNVSAGYPKCMLCRENVGYVGQGRTRRNMRTVPLKLAGEDWFWQFSPYAYFYHPGYDSGDCLWTVAESGSACPAPLRLYQCPRFAAAEIPWSLPHSIGDSGGRKGNRSMFYGNGRRSGYRSSLCVRKTASGRYGTG